MGVSSRRRAAGALDLFSYIAMHKTMASPRAAAPCRSAEGSNFKLGARKRHQYLQRICQVRGAAPGGVEILCSAQYFLPGQVARR
jgi:hypothetical protein